MQLYFYSQAVKTELFPNSPETAKPQEFENAGFAFVWTENSFKTELRHNNHGAIYLHEFFSNTNLKW